jgi:hypothetical protein
MSSPSTEDRPPLAFYGPDGLTGAEQAAHDAWTTGPYGDLGMMAAVRAALAHQREEAWQDAITVLHSPGSLEASRNAAKMASGLRDMAKALVEMADAQTVIAEVVAAGEERIRAEVAARTAPPADAVSLRAVLDALRDEADQRLARATDAPERAYARGVSYSATFLAHRFGERR